MNTTTIQAIARGSNPAVSDGALALQPQLVLFVQSRLVEFHLLQKADGIWGAKSIRALNTFKLFSGITELGIGKVTATKLLVSTLFNLIPGFKLKGDWASRTLMWMIYHKQHLNTNPGEINVVYFRGLDSNGHWNGNEPFVYNDRRTVLVISDGVPTFTGNWLATCDPGEYYWENPMNDKGCADIKAWQFQAWSVGDHKGQNALIQSDTITVLRGEQRTEDTADDFRIDQHSVGIGQDNNYGDPVGRWSAGCMVGASRSEHDDEFMPIVQASTPEKANPGSCKHWTTVINGNDFLDLFPT